MLEPKLDDLAMDLETALGPRKTGKCGCNELTLNELTPLGGGDVIALPAAMPPLQTLAAEVQAALSASRTESGPEELVDGLGEAPVTLEDLLELLRQNPGLKLHLSF